MYPLKIPSPVFLRQSWASYRQHGNGDGEKDERKTNESELPSATAPSQPDQLFSYASVRQSHRGRVTAIAGVFLKAGLPMFSVRNANVNDACRVRQGPVKKHRRVEDALLDYDSLFHLGYRVHSVESYFLLIRGFVHAFQELFLGCHRIAVDLGDKDTRREAIHLSGAAIPPRSHEDLVDPWSEMESRKS